MRKLRKAELQLLEDLGLHEQKPLSYTKVVWGVEVLLLASTAMLFLTMHLAGELHEFSPLDALEALFTHSQGNSKDRALEVDLRNENSLRNFHVMASMVGHVVLVPQLVMLVLVAEEKTSMVLQFILTVVILLATGVTQAVQKSITDAKEETCLERRTCAHNSCDWYFFINNIGFIVTVLIRLPSASTTGMPCLRQSLKLPLRGWEKLTGRSSLEGGGTEGIPPSLELGKRGCRPNRYSPSSYQGASDRTYHEYS